jgi:hypothetical protein
MLVELSPDEIQVLARPGLAEESERLGVRVLRAFGGTRVHIPDEHEPYIRKRIADELAGEAIVEKDDLVGGRPYLKADYEAAGKLHVAGKMTVEGVKKRRELSTKRAYRIYRQLRADAVLGVLRPGHGYRWESSELEKDPQGSS